MRLLYLAVAVMMLVSVFAQFNIVNVIRVASEYVTEVKVINNEARNLTDQQIKINISGFDTTNMYVVDSNGSPLYYFIINSTLWVKVPFIQANSFATIYIHYGGISNPYSTYRDPVKVFEIYYDENEGTYTTTTKYAGSISLSDTNNPFNGSLDIMFSDTSSSSGGSAAVYVSMSIASPVVVEAWIYPALDSNILDHKIAVMFYYDGYNHYMIWYGNPGASDAPDFELVHSSDLYSATTDYSSAASGWSQNNMWYHFNATITSSSVSLTVTSRDGTFSENVTFSNPVGKNPNEVGMWFRTGSGQTGKIYADMIYAYKIADYTIEFVSTTTSTTSTGTTVTTTTTTSSTPSYTYEMPITISNNGTADLTNYTVRVVVPSSTTGYANLTLDNVYFVDGVGNPLYYFAEYKGTGAALLWVKVPSIPAGGSVTIYMRWGGTNPYPAYNDPAQVFIFWDDFETWSGWTNYGSGTVSQSADVAFSGAYSLKKDTDNDPSGGYKNIGTTITTNYCVFAMIYRPSVYSGGAADRISIVDASGNGYGSHFNHYRDDISVDIRSGWSANYYGNISISYDPLDMWYVLEGCVAGGVFYARAYTLDDMTMIGEYSYSITERQVDTVFVAGGYHYYVDNLRIVTWSPDVSVELGTSTTTTTTSTSSWYLGSRGMVIKVPRGSSGNASFVVVSNGSTDTLTVAVSYNPWNLDIALDPTEIVLDGTSSYNVSIAVTVPETTEFAALWLVGIDVIGSSKTERFWLGVFPLNESSANVTVFTAESDASGWWVGGAGVYYDSANGTFWLIGRYRSPTDRGYAQFLAHSSDGIHYVIDKWFNKTDYGYVSVEKGDIIYAGDGWYIAWWLADDNSVRYQGPLASPLDWSFSGTVIASGMKDPVLCINNSIWYVGLANGVDSDNPWEIWSGTNIDSVSKVFAFPSNSWGMYNRHVGDIIVEGRWMVVFYDASDQDVFGVGYTGVGLWNPESREWIDLSYNEPLWKSPYGYGSARYANVIATKNFIIFYVEIEQPDGSHNLVAWYDGVLPANSTTTTTTTTTNISTTTTTTDSNTTVATSTAIGGSNVVVIGGWGMIESVVPLLLVVAFGVGIVIVMRK